MSTALHVVPPLRHRPELRAELVGDGAALRALEGEWSALCQSARAGCLFLAPEWLLPWWDCFGAGDSARELRCITIRADGKCVETNPL